MIRKSNYIEKLKDPRWQKMRLEVMQRDKFSCQLCGDNESPLNVHHLTYKGENPWDVDINQLVTLCEGCHQWESENRKVMEEGLLGELKRIGARTHFVENLSCLFSDLKIIDELPYSKMQDKLWKLLLGFRKLVEHPELIDTLPNYQSDKNTEAPF